MHYQLDDSGVWYNAESGSYFNGVLYDGGTRPELTIETEDGTVRSVSYAFTLLNDASVTLQIDSLAQPIYLSLAAARPGTGPFQVEDLWATMDGWRAGDTFRTQWEDVSLTYAVEIIGVVSQEYPWDAETDAGFAQIPDLENQISVVFRADLEP